MESQLFTWTGGWDSALFSFSFYDCTLTVAVGANKPGERFEGIDLDYEKGTISLFIEGSLEPETHPLLLSVG
jgi:hypothetical protein